MKWRYLTNRNRRFIHIYNGKSVTKVYYDRPGSIYVGKLIHIVLLLYNYYNILEDFENASLYIGYFLLKNFLKVERMYKINIESCTPAR